jgi:hypothetical protein
MHSHTCCTSTVTQCFPVWPQPGRLRMDEHHHHHQPGSPQRPAYRPLPLAAPPAAAGDSPLSDSGAPGRGWPLRGYDLEEDLDALDEHEELYGEVEQVGSKG